MHHEFLYLAGGGLVISIIAVAFSRRTGVATPLLLLALGFAVSFIPSVPPIHVHPEVILTGVLPPLLYAAAVNLPVLDLRRNLGMISWLALVLVVVGALLVGGVVHTLFGIPLPLAIALGAVVSPTDAVAATAIGRRLGLPPRVMSILEGESLVNDASALVVLRSALAALSVGSFSLGEATVDFGWAVLGAIITGWLVGWATVLVRQRLADPVLNTSISFAVPFLAFIPAEEIGASGVLSVVVAGLVTGHQAGRRFTARDRQMERTNWATILFLLETAVFLVMGLELPRLVEEARGETSDLRILAMVAVVVALLILIRFVGVAGPLLMDRRLRPERTTRKRQRLEDVQARLEEFSPETTREMARVQVARHHIRRSHADVEFGVREALTGRSGLVLAWCGMRGVVTLAAVQTLPVDADQRATVVVVAVLVAVVTLVLFGLSLPPLIRRLSLQTTSPERKRGEFFALMKQLSTATVDALGPMEELVIDGEPIDPDLADSLKRRFLPILLGQIQHLRTTKPGTREKSLVVQRLYLDAMREALLVERSIGAYTSETYAAAEALLDREEQRLNAGI
ncbi:cation:proton antiporter [Nocardioides daejeonensis]|uniref:cation:proton antiporter n=1 Tax=Nocardioides daejeonensis TaxID=1046556 RepID=UPI000D742541|nr:sodium:proton antiporter [Nocardioides daejeonensis]